jgi:hypothetical protein
MTEKKTAPKADVKEALDAAHPADPASRHASSTPDQASQSQKDDAPFIPAGAATDEPEEADNVIERTTQEMARAGHAASEIAAYREEALRNIGGAPKVEHEEK